MERTCGTIESMVAAVHTVLDNGWTVNTDHGWVRIIRPDGMVFDWEFVAEWGLFCLKLGEAL